MGVLWEGLRLLQDKQGGRATLWGMVRAHLVSVPPRLWKKVWGHVPSPQKFFQPLYVGHSGDFKVSALQPAARPPPQPRLLWELTSAGAPGTPHLPTRLRAAQWQSAGNNSGGADLVPEQTQDQAACRSQTLGRAGGRGGPGSLSRKLASGSFRRGP